LGRIEPKDPGDADCQRGRQGISRAPLAKRFGLAGKRLDDRRDKSRIDLEFSLLDFPDVLLEDIEQFQRDPRLFDRFGEFLFERVPLGVVYNERGVPSLDCQEWRTFDGCLGASPPAAPVINATLSLASIKLPYPSYSLPANEELSPKPSLPIARYPPST